MRGTLFILPALLIAWSAQAAGKVVVVLPLDASHAAGKLDANAKVALEEMLRDVAVENLGGTGWTVLTGETTLQVLKDNGVDAATCGDQSCHLSMAREIKAEKFISGSVQFSDGEFTASIRLIDTATGRIAASTRVEGTTSKALRKAFEGEASKFFQKAGMAEASPAPAPAPAPPAPPASAKVADTEPPARADPVGPQNPPASSIPFRVGQIWSGDYECGQGPMSFQLLVQEVSGETVKAVFSFADEQDSVVGSYAVQGRYDRKTRQWSAKPGEWLAQPPGFISLGFVVRVSDTGGELAGKVSHDACGQLNGELETNANASGEW